MHFKIFENILYKILKEKLIKKLKRKKRDCVHISFMTIEVVLFIAQHWHRADVPRTGLRRFGSPWTMESGADRVGHP